jgi:hypothetical protein
MGWLAPGIGRGGLRLGAETLEERDDLGAVLSAFNVENV